MAFAAAAADAEAATLRTAVIKAYERPLQPISRLDEPPEDEGSAGAERATADNATTGRFLGHTYETETVEPTPEEAVAELDRLIGEGVRFVVALVDGATLERLAARAAEAAPEAVIVNAYARDDRLRAEACPANVFHVAPSRAMLADGLAQYLIWKKWGDWALVRGTEAGDEATAEAMRRSARKFGAEVVEERVFEQAESMRTSDTGHVLVQRQIPTFMQGLPDHHVVLAADENELFATYLPYRTWEPRPVAGDAGLRALSWHPSHESWGATQLQRRFERDQGRTMTEVDYQAWLALRVLGEAVTRTNSAEPRAVRDYLVSDQFEIAAFKGQALTFRPWNQQLRQGVLLADGRSVVSVSPQEEFLHQRTRLDTLGFDEPESDCSLN
ncbi:MAG: ABC transporter substrate-binding protein [Paracoccaceae bacterium]